MSSDQGATTPREVVAEAAVKRAKNGDLPLLRSHRLVYNSGSYQSSLPKTFFENVPYEKGDVSGAYADFEEGLLVLDFQRGEEYER